MKTSSLSSHLRRDEIVDLLARGVIRMYERGLIHKTPTGYGRLDRSSDLPLSVAERPQRLTPHANDGDTQHD
jgi:hypothetical protein